MRRTFVYRDGKVVEKTEAGPNRGAGLQIVGDIEPFVSVAGPKLEYIGGRKQRRDHMRAHELIEVGSEKIAGGTRNIDPKPMPPLGPDIKRAMDQQRSR